MAVYEYFCPKCLKEFELMRPMSEAEKPAKCPKCGSKAQKLMSGLGSKTGDPIQLAGEPFRKRTVVRAPSSKAKAAKTNKRQTTR
jgi:putative FmdB family regulatory protein